MSPSRADAAESPAMHWPLCTRRQFPHPVQHWAAITAFGMPGHVLVLSCTPGKRQPSTSEPLVPAASPLSTFTPPGGMLANGGGDGGGVVGGGDGGGGGRGDGFVTPPHGNEVKTGCWLYAQPAFRHDWLHNSRPNEAQRSAVSR